VGSSIAFVILVFVETQDATTALPGALAQAAEEALGPRATVSVRAIEPAMPAPALVAAGREQRAQAVARLSWLGAERLEARLEVTVIATGRIAAQPVSFEPSDPLQERGRALGLVLASLLRPEATSEAPPPPTPAPAAVTVAALPPPPPAAPVLVRWPWAVDVAGEGGFALRGSGSGAGGTVGVRWSPLARVGFRVGARARFGEVSSAKATSYELAGAAGVVLGIVQPAAGQHFGLGVRAEGLLIYELLSHVSSSDPQPVRQGRLLPGASVVAEARWLLGPSVALMLAAGPEVAFGTTQVVVNEIPVAELAPTRLIVQGGLVASF
jgi:hypothetical protein